MSYSAGRTACSLGDGPLTSLMRAKVKAPFPRRRARLRAEPVSEKNAAPGGAACFGVSGFFASRPTTAPEAKQAEASRQSALGPGRGKTRLQRATDQPAAARMRQRSPSRSGPQFQMASSSGPTPMIAITCFMLARTWRIISVRTLSSVLVRKWALPIHALRVPNGYSTVCRRMAIASGIRWNSATDLNLAPFSHGLGRTRLFPGGCADGRFRR